MLALAVMAAAVLTAGCAASSTPRATSPASSARAVGAASQSVPATAVSPSSVSPGTGALTSNVPACTSADLQASLGGGTGAGMSQDHTGLQLRNIGSSACTVQGYPAVSWVAETGGDEIGRPAARSPDATGRTEQVVTLAPGAMASAPLDIVAAAAIPQAECKPVAVSGLQVYPPGGQPALFIPLPTPAGGYGECSLATKQPTLIVGYVQAGVQPGGGGLG